MLDPMTHVVTINTLTTILEDHEYSDLEADDHVEDQVVDGRRNRYQTHMVTCIYAAISMGILSMLFARMGNTTGCDLLVLVVVISIFTNWVMINNSAGYPATWLICVIAMLMMMCYWLIYDESSAPTDGAVVVVAMILHTNVTILSLVVP